MDISNQYRVEFTDECKNEIRKIYNYVKEELYAESAAQNLMIKVEEYISNLSYASRIYAEIDKYRETERVYRRIVINNYVILYTIEEENKKVYITYVLWRERLYK